MSTAFALLLVCVFFACGSALRDGAVAQSVIAALAALAIACVGRFARAADVSAAARSVQDLKLAAAIPAIWMILQLLPTPIGAHSIWTYANDALGWQSWGHVSVDLGMTLLTLVFYLANVALIVVAVFVARDRRRAALLLLVLTAITPVLTLVLLLSRSRLIPSLDAGDFSEVLPAIGAFGILLSLTTATRAWSEHESNRSEREDSIRRVTLMGCGIALAIGLLGVGIGATLNGCLVAAFGVVSFGSIEIIRRTALPGWAALMLATTLMIAAAMIISWRFDPTRAVSPLLQFATGSSNDAVAVTQRLLSDTRWLGAGAGTYQSLLPIYQDLGNSVVKAPSTASVLTIELGWPMFLVVMVAAIWLIVLLCRGAHARGRDSFYPTAAAACAIVILCEAFCDTSLLRSSVAILGDAVIGLGLAQRFSPRNAPY